MVSWILAAIGALGGFGAYSDPDIPVALKAPGLPQVYCAYALWACYWGAIRFGGLWRASLAKLGSVVNRSAAAKGPARSPDRYWLERFIFGLLLSFFVLIPWMVCTMFYGVFGGGFYQYFRHRRLARR